MKELIQGKPDLLITVVGIGGCGCNTINMLAENELSDSVNLIAVNTDLGALSKINVTNKILIGENLTKGYGAGSNPEIGLQAAKESEDLLRSAIKGSDVVIVTAGFGGGTGTGASPLVASIAREFNISCLAVVTLPFASEGQKRMEFALQGIKAIKEPVHAYITLSNDLLLKSLDEKVGLLSAFKASNQVLKNLLSALVQMLSETGYVNVDKNDFSSILSFEGESILGVGKADSHEQAFEALDQALNNPLVSLANIDSAKGIIFQFFCKEEPDLATYHGLIDHIRNKITNNSVLIVSGFTLDTNLSSELEILIIASGIEPSVEAINHDNLKVNNSVKNHIQEKKNRDDSDYLDDDLTFIAKAEVYTDIPAITRKMMEKNGTCHTSDTNPLYCQINEPIEVKE